MTVKILKGKERAMKRTALYMDNNTYQELKSLADEHELSVNETCVQLIEYALSQHKKKGA